MSTETREMLHSQLISQREILDELWERIDNGDHVIESLMNLQDLTEEEAEVSADEYAEQAREELDELPLEIVWEMGEPFAVILGTGGPHIEIRGGTRHDGSAYSLHGYWGGEHVTISGESITRTGEYFRELVEEG